MSPASPLPPAAPNEVDPLALAQALIRCPSVTPEDAGALAVLEAVLRPMGFVCERMRFEDDGSPAVDNLWARLGTERPNVCFAGHTDVVPPGDRALWSADPFAGELRDGRLWGRGASDMKTAIACFVAAVSRILPRTGAPPGAGVPRGSISLLITGDEEGPSVNGTRKMLRVLADRGEAIDWCVVGEPTNPHELGEMMKVGRRGSLNAEIIVHGTQGHSAYPHLADNPVSRLVRLLVAIEGTPLDGGSAHFQPSTVALTSIDVGNPATNVIPAAARARLNVRFNDRHTGEGVQHWLADRCAEAGGRIDLRCEVSGESFLCPPSGLAECVAAAVRTITGRTPEASTSGGTSDARFIKDFCAVCEFGMVGESAHKVDENVRVQDIETLTRIYRTFLEDVLVGTGIAR